jgi:calcium/calmodulin-dependent protein kinase I
VPEIKALQTKARLRRGIEMVRLANRIEALKMKEDDAEDVPGEADVPANAREAAGAALAAGKDKDGRDLRPGLSTSTSAIEGVGAGSGQKKSLSKIAKGAIFREVVLAKVREMKADEERVALEKTASAKADQK